MNVSDSSFRRWIYLVLILAALLRFGFLVSGEVLPVMWDARRYACAALGLISLTYDPVNIDSLDKEEDVAAFNRYYGQYISGEKIDWQFYPRPGLTDAREELFFSGPLYPAMLATIFYLAPMADFTFARFVGICFDILAVLLIMLVAVRLVGRRAAVVTGFLYAIYFPFVITSTMLLLETSTSFFILLSIHVMMRGVETDRRWPFILVGVVSGLLVLHKPTAMLLGVPFVIGLYFYTRQRWRISRYLRALMLIAVPALLLFGAWIAVASAKYGQVTLRDPTYAGANLRQSASIDYEGYDLDTVEEKFWERSIYSEPFRQWKGYLGLFAKKFERLWGRPYNDFKRVFILPLQAVESMHQAIVAFGLLGLLLLLVRGPSQAAWPLVICGYYTSIHLIFHSINRYAFNAMPFMMIGAAFLAVLAADRMIVSRDRRLGRVVASLGLIVTGWLLQPTMVNVLLGTGLSEVLVTVVLCIKVGLWLAAFILLAGLFLESHQAWKRVAFVMTAGFVFALMSWVPVLSREGWTEFSCRLDDPKIKAGTRIYISNLEDVSGQETLELLIDVTSSMGRQNTFTVSVCDWQANYILGKKPLSSGFYPKATYLQYAQLELIGQEVFRQYAILTVEQDDMESMLNKFGYLDISVAVNDHVSEPYSYLTLYGKHYTGGDVHFIPTPTFSAIERYVHRGDPRIREPVKFMSDSSISYYIGRQETDVIGEQDLSPLAGKQKGRYNIFLIHFKQDGSILVY